VEWVEVEEKVKVKVKDEEEWVAVAWAPAENADVHNAAIQCHIKSGCHAISRPAQNAEVR